MAWWSARNSVMLLDLSLGNQMETQLENQWDSTSGTSSDLRRVFESEQLLEEELESPSVLQ